MLATATIATDGSVKTTAIVAVTDDNDNGGGGSGGGGGSRHATAAVNGMVWGRCQAARGGGNGNKVEMGIMWVW